MSEGILGPDARQYGIGFYSQDLYDAFKQFTQAMELGLIEAAKKGYTGWNDPDAITYIDLQDRLASRIEKEDWADAANYLLMLHHRYPKPVHNPENTGD